MKIEVLVTTMHQNNISKYKEMNLQTDAIIANQADKNEIIEKIINEKLVKMITTDTRGVSINRNIALVHSNADIIIFADDDQQFVDGYENLIIKEFEKHHEADAIKFYCESTNIERPLAFKKPKTFMKASKKKLMSAGVNGLAIKRKVLSENSLFFNQAIGPGQKIFCGEDTIFLNALCQYNANIYISPILISVINQGESSWFKGYSEQYFISIGYIYDCVYGAYSPLAIIRRAFRFSKNKKCDFSKREMVCMMLKGRKLNRKHI